MKELVISFLLVVVMVAVGLGIWWVIKIDLFAVGPKPIIEATIRLDNRCSVKDDVFIVSAPKLGRKKAFHDGVAGMKLPEGTLVQLAASPAYPDVVYDGIPDEVSANMTLIADCSLSPRMEGIFGSMKKAFSN